MAEPSKIDRLLIIQKATDLFRKKGYHQTSMDDIAAACQLQKSSLYHHIPSRKALVIMVIEQTLSYFQQNHFSLAYDDKLSPEKRLQCMADETLHFFHPNKQGCLITNLAIEIREAVPEVKELIAIYFADWIKAIAFILDHNYSTDVSRKLAEDIVAQIQGAILIGKITHNDEPLKRAAERLAQLCQRTTSSY